MKLDERLAATKIYLRLGKIAVLKKSIPVNEDKMEIEPVYCNQFGCGKRLKRQEYLFGNQCIKHK